LEARVTRSDVHRLLMAVTTRVGAFAGYDPNDSKRWPYVWVFGESTDGYNYHIGIRVSPEHFKPGNAGPLDYNYASGWLGNWSPWTWQSDYLGDLVSGRVELDAAGLRRGAPVSGRFQAKVIRW
jgi:hypothetical protein